MGYYGWPTMDADNILAANPQNETSPDAKQAPAGNNDKQGNEERTATDDATCAANQSHQPTWILTLNYSAKSVSDEELIALNCGYKSGDKTNNPTRKGLEKAERNDEEECRRIPIPQSDDESEGDTWLDESDGSDQERDIRTACVVSRRGNSNVRTMESKVNRPTTDDFAFVTVLDEMEPSS
jgi:hypothetical protein